MKKRCKVLMPILVLILLITGCYKIEENKGEEKMKFSIVNDHLIIEKGNEKYYVSKEESDETFKLSKDIGVILKDYKGKLYVKFDIDGNKATSAMINGIDISKGLIMINGKMYKIYPQTYNLSNELDINVLFRGFDENKLVLNPSNYEEFIDESGGVYTVGGELDQEDIGAFLYPVSLKGEDVYTITFDKETMKTYSFKDKILMLKDGKEANDIKSIDYEGLYQYEDGFAIGMNNKYFRLENK